MKLKHTRGVLLTPYDSRGNDRDRYQARRHRPTQADQAADTRGNFARSDRYGYGSRYGRYDGSGYGSDSRYGSLRYDSSRYDNGFRYSSTSQRQTDGQHGHSAQGRTGDRQQYSRYYSSRTPESNYQSRYQPRYRSSYQSSNDNGYRSSSYGPSGRYASSGSRNPYEPNGQQHQGRTDSRDAPQSHSGRRGQGQQGRNRNAPRRQPRNAKRPHKGLKPWILGVLIAVGVVVAAIAGYTAYINGRLQSNDAELLASLKQSDENEPFYMLLMGVDSDEERQAEGDTGRSDSIMLVRVDPVNVKVTMVSIHRDTLVNISGYGNSKINAAYAYGGKALMVQTVSQFAGVDISHYAEVDFNSFSKIVDAIGGIEVTLPMDVYDPDYTGLDLKAGPQTLDGNTALLLCRCRHAYDAYNDGDQYRAAAQRMVITAMVKKILSSDAATMVSAITQLSGSVTTDMDVSSILSLAAKMKGLDFDNDVQTAINPTTSAYINGIWYEKSNSSEWKTMMARVDAGESPTTDSSDSSSGDGSDDDQQETGSVQVLNCTGTSGLAARLASRLGQLGYNATATDGGKRDNTTTTVYYNGSANQSKAEALARHLGDSVSAQKNDGTYSTSYDMVVVVGDDLQQQTE